MADKHRQGRVSCREADRRAPRRVLLLTLLGVLIGLFGARAHAQSDARYADEGDVQTLLGLAEQGDARACYLLGTRYASGRGGIRDDSQAVRWFTRAAEGGLGEAQYNLGIMYSGGRGTARDLRQAARWFRSAAEQGLAEAQYNLGTLYAAGDGVPQDFTAAARWLGKAAEQGVAGAQYNLAVLYEYGKGVQRDLERALNWYRHAQEQGYARARGPIDRLAPLFPGNAVKGVPAQAGSRSVQAPAPLSRAEWFRRQDPDMYTIQVFGVAKEAAARAFIQDQGLEGEAAYFEVRRLGKPWFAVIHGLYAGWREAEAARQALPAEIQVNKPWTRSLRSLMEIAAGG